ncbi:hypothetical protein GCM10020358_61110 [Amorphoplanes nipponensis]|uniref:Uncharacterized protein n=1 Tax=Actinoplanes nipponensis TaxID=135950 RepID=A0A919MLG1_9ACTN|nr:hypothetical protein [Actinoplanes nipponensis]GIE53914.1 hypothetical protein Ani05nite_74480 [Actinoplanes nipponensis]
MFLLPVSWSDLSAILNAAGAVVILVGGALDVARKVRELHDRRRDDEGDR